MNKLLSILVVLSLGLIASAQEVLVDRHLNVALENSTPEDAKQQGLEKAIASITEELGKDFLGEERYLRNRTVVTSKILKNSAKYIPFSKATFLSTVQTTQNVRVDLKISRINFRQLLQDQGLLSQGESQPVVIPYVTWIDRVRSKSYRWWKDRGDLSSESLVKQEKAMEHSLKASFYKSGFYVWKPLEVSLWNQLPTLYQSERLTPDDFQSLGLYFQAPMAIEGQIVINKSLDRNDRFNIEIKWTAFLTENGKTVGDVSRQFVSEAGPQDRVVDKKLSEVLDLTAGDLSNQILEAWQKGTLSSKTLKLSLRATLGLKAQENFRDKIKTDISVVKSIRERWLSKDQISFEIESPATAQELASKLNHFEFENKKYKTEVMNDNEVVLILE